MNFQDSLSPSSLSFQVLGVVDYTLSPGMSCSYNFTITRKTKVFQNRGTLLHRLKCSLISTRRWLRIIGTDRKAMGLQNRSKGGLLLGTCWGTALGPGARGWEHGLSQPPSPQAWVGVSAVLGLQEGHQSKSRSQTPLGLGGPQGGAPRDGCPFST